MIRPELVEYTLLLAIALLTGFAALWLFSRFDRSPSDTSGPEADGISYLFDGEKLINATQQGLTVLMSPNCIGVQWDDFHTHFTHRFHALPTTATGARSNSRLSLTSHYEDDDAQLEIAPDGNMIRVTLIDPVPAGAADRHIQLTANSRLHSIIAGINSFEHPAWFSDSDDKISWANERYLLHVRQHFPDWVPSDPVPHLFEIDPDQAELSSKRCALQVSDEAKAHWFELSSRKFNKTLRMQYAICIDAIVEGEIAQRRLLQTLTKTFAHLSTGLAVFDRDRRLALFNPALIDLTDLPAEFLSCQPDMLSFFDRLRESQIMPEPKDYSNWRHHIADLVMAAHSDRFQETWSLPSGLTYEVTGKPHPDGAIAFLFNDITAEISLTRQFRAQLALGQSVIDNLDEAIAVVSTGGEFLLSNDAFVRMWKIDPTSSIASVTIQDAIAQWRRLAGPDEVWTKIGEFVQHPEDRAEWFADAALKDGTAIECRVAPLAGNSTMVGFKLKPLLTGALPARESDTAGD